MSQKNNILITKPSGLTTAPFAEPSWLSAGTQPITNFKGHPEKSLFSGHSLEVKQIQPLYEPIAEAYWISGIILLIAILFVWLNSGYRKRLRQIFEATLSMRYLNQFLREDYTLNGIASILLSLIFILASALFVFQANTAYHFLFLKEKGIELYFIICACIVIIYSIKLITVAFIGFVLNIKKEISEYILTIFMFNETLGLLLIPVVIAIAYIKIIPLGIFYMLGVGIIVVTLSYRLLRGLFFNINNQRISKSYLFVYLCTLEILPLIVFIKLFIRR
ncbi:MAG TPA: DUF4271 domain-containing protein [Bacteroidia bacterium]|nr:DUF4271 domain-containing protein [Bacteroidia bacterium]